MGGENKHRHNLRVVFLRRRVSSAFGSLRLNSPSCVARSEVSPSCGVGATQRGHMILYNRASRLLSTSGSLKFEI